MTDWIAKLLRGATPNKRKAPPTAEEIVAEFLALSGAADRAKQLPAWALLFCSPFAHSDDATSWLGGAPKAPDDFEWPKDKDGSPLLFIAQIDLASLEPEPQTGLRPPGLPSEGALLVFIGDSYACRILTPAQMASARVLAPPSDLGSIRKHGFFGEGQSFVRRPVTPVAYLDDGAGRPAFVPDPFKSPLDWIVNWSVAALEAQNVIDSLKRDLKSGDDFLSWFASQEDKQGRNNVIRNKFEHYSVIRNKAPAVVAALETWRDLALSKPPDESVDKSALGDILRLRRELHDEMHPHYSKLMVTGREEEVWAKIRLQYPGLSQGEGYDELPSCYRHFIDMRETDWRGHRLFGIEPPFGNNWEDLRGQDCVISIAADALLHTTSEHDYGFSVWCPRDRMGRGLFHEGQLVRHCAV